MVQHDVWLTFNNERQIVECEREEESGWAKKWVSLLLRMAAAHASDLSEVVDIFFYYYSESDRQLGNSCRKVQS